MFTLGGRERHLHFLLTEDSELELRSSDAVLFFFHRGELVGTNNLTIKSCETVRPYRNTLVRVGCVIVFAMGLSIVAAAGCHAY